MLVFEVFLNSDANSDTVSCFCSLFYNRQEKDVDVRGSLAGCFIRRQKLQGHTLVVIISPLTFSIVSAEDRNTTRDV